MLKTNALILQGSAQDCQTVAEVRSPEWAEKEALKVPDGMFAVEALNTGTRYFAQLGTGTQRRFGMACPVVQLFYVQTTVVDGSIWGTLGNRVTVGQSRHFTRPDNVL